MSDLWTFQTNMNRGELDPQLTGRIDLAAYYNGLRTATNVLTIPQGGVKKRPGQEYLADAEGNGRLENFSFNVEQNYLLAFSNGKMQIFKDGVLQININGSGNAYLVTPWTLAQIEDFDYIHDLIHLLSLPQTCSSARRRRSISRFANNFSPSR